MEKQVQSNIDFAALKALKTVRDLGSISKAARQLDVDQSAISHTIRRLRKVFDDPLFIRVKSGIVSTGRCDQIAQQADEMLKRFDELTRGRSFDPAHDEFEAVIGVSHAGIAVLLTRVIHILRQRAPGARIRVVDSRASAYEALEAGSCDILIRPMPYEKQSCHRRHILREGCVCLVDRNSPYAERGITLDEYAAANHAMVTFEGVYRPPWLVRMEALGKPLNVVLDLASTSEIDEFVAGTDLVATVSELFGRACRETVARIDAPLEAYQNIYMFWADRTDEVEHLKWTRRLIEQVAASLAEVESRWI